MNPKTKRTSLDWYKEILLKNPKLKIIYPDGWDRKNFRFSFYKEKITKKEFDRRLYNSTLYLDNLKI